MTHLRSINIACRLLLCACLLFTTSGAFSQSVQRPPARGFEVVHDEEDDGVRIKLNFENATVDSVLKYLSEVAGLVIVQFEQAEGRVSVMSRQEMTTSQAIALLNSVLKEKDLAAVRTGKTLKIVKLADAKTMNIPVRVGSDPLQIEETDQVITQVIPIRNADAKQLVEDLGVFISDEADIAANASSNSIVITDTSARIRRIAKMISALDLAIDQVLQVRVFGLQYADANDTARLINEIFGQSGRSSGSSRSDAFRAMMAARFGRPPGSGGGGSQPSGSSSARRSDVQIKASSDDRTNTVVVSGPAEVMDVVADMLKELDSNHAAAQDVFVYKVIYGDATHLESVLNTLFDSDIESGRKGTGPSDGGSARSDGTARRRDSSSGGNSASGSSAPRFPPLGGFGGDGGGTGAAPMASDLLGQVRVVADEATNALLVMAAPASFQRVRTVIESLDVASPQVLIKVLVAEVTHSDGTDIGMEYSIVSDDSTVNLMQQFGLNSAVQTAQPGFSINVVNANLDLTVRVLQEIGNLEVLSRPYILASDNQDANITVGEEVPFITNTQFTELGGTRNTVRYEDVGIILNVTPHIGPNGLVTMDVSPEISALSGETVPISDSVDAPVIAKRSAKTRVALRSGQTIIIGGLMEDEKTVTRRQIPGLGELPIIGPLFGRDIEEVRKTELLIFLTPQIAQRPEELEPLTDQEAKDLRILPNAINKGAFQRHIENMTPATPGSKEVDAGMKANQPAETK